MNLGENIYRLRRQRNMSQDALAEALEVSRQSVSKWENNSAIPELDKLIKMSELFGVSLDKLVGKEPPTPPPQPAVSESAPRTQTPPCRMIGVILLCFGLMVTLLLSILGGFFLGVLAGLPFTIVGCILISSTEGYLFKSAWSISAIYAPLMFFFLQNFVRYGFRYRWAVLVVWFAALVTAAVCLHRSGKLSAESRKLMFGSIIVAAVLLILLGIATQALYRATGLYSIP